MSTLTFTPFDYDNVYMSPSSDQSQSPVYGLTTFEQYGSLDSTGYGQYYSLPSEFQTDSPASTSRPKSIAPATEKLGSTGRSSEPVAEKHNGCQRNERRRQQNRVSQRAFRERKDRERKTLESQVEALREKHQRLTNSYSQQSEEVVKLRHQMEDLMTQIHLLQTDLSAAWRVAPQMPQEFDLVPLPFYDDRLARDDVNGSG